MIPQPPNWLCHPTMRLLCFPPSPAHPSPAGLGWGLSKTHSCIHQVSCPGCSMGPGSTQPSLSHLPSLCFCLQFFVCLIFPFFLSFASIISLLASPFSFPLNVCLQGFPSIHSPQPFLSPHFHHPLPLPPVHSPIPLLPSAFPAAIRANQIPEQLCKAISGSSLIPGGGEQSWTIRLSHAAPSLINTTTNMGLWEHLCPPGPANTSGHTGTAMVGSSMEGDPEEHSCPPSSCPCVWITPFEEAGGCFWWGQSLCGRAHVQGLLQRISPLAPQPSAPLLLLDL